MFACASCTIVSLSATSLNFITPPHTWFAPFMQDSWSKSRKDPQNSNNSVYKHSLGPDKKRLLSVIIAHVWTLKVIANSEVGASQFTKYRAAFCHCFAPCLCFASCNCYCCHDPFIVRSAQTCPPFTGFTQLAHPSRCSRSTLTTLCSCAFVFP